MAVPLNEILQKKGSLHRTPPPRAPSNKPPPATRNNPIPNNNTEVNIAQLIPGVKLRKTGMRDSLIAEDVDNKHTADTDEPENELQSIIAKRRAMFDHKEEAEVVKPKKPPKPRPKPSVDNHKPGKENLQTKQRSGSTCSDSSGENKDIILTNKNRNVVCRDSRGDPKLCNLPTMESLGKAPAKPSKPDSLVKLLEKYESKSVIMAPRRSVLQSSSNTSMGDAIVEDNDDGEMYDDVDEIKNQILGGQEDEQGKQEANGIFEENYDDVGGMEENTGSNTQGQNPEPICDENYDDLDTVKEQALQIQNDFVGGHQSFIGGEELYDVLAAEEENRDGKNHGGHDTQIENNNTPPPLPSSSLPRKEKAKKDLKKEMENQKKKEKEELKKKKEDEKRREREEKEEKKRKEEEKKKRERVDKELCRKHKIKPGNENTGIGEARSNFAGDGKFELPVKERDPLVVVSEKNCPQGKWLVQNTAGHYGYIPTELIQLKIDSDGNRMSAIITEDFYEDVDQYQKGGQIIEEEDDQEVYDDIGGQDPIDEELYEELPADQ